jgi:hypothetical protein
VPLNTTLQVEVGKKLSAVAYTETFTDDDARAYAGMLSAENCREGTEETLGADVVGLETLLVVDAVEELGKTVEDGRGFVEAGVGFVGAGGGSKMIPN